MSKLLLILLLFMGTTVVNAHPSYGIAVDDEGAIYFADIIHNGRGSVWKLTSEGNLELLLSNFHAHNLILTANQELITAQGEEWHTLLRLKPNGIKDTLYHTANFREFNGGNYTFTSTGNIVFGIDNFLWVINSEGKKRKLSDHMFGWNQIIHAHENGYIYATDIGDSTGKIYQIDQAGKALVYAAGLLTHLPRGYDKHQDVLLGMTSDGNGNLYVAETAGQRIIKILTDGSHETFYRSKDDYFPTGLDFSNNQTYILEFKMKGGNAGPRITRVDSAGGRKVVFDFETHHKKVSPIVAPNTPNSGTFLWVLGMVLIMVIGVIVFLKMKLHAPAT
ncbi:MAG: hypothetical protein HKO54_02750 [Flavobacteriaceae bacterium]|nr:hypothetical protein [Flavobacteriaceae bacterium]